MSSYEKTMKSTAVITAAGTVLLYLLNRRFPSDLFFTLMITFGVTCYHFIMRLAVGGILQGLLHNHVDYHHKWFQPLAFEDALYRKLKVKQWKKKMPTYAPQSFSLKEHTLEEVVQAMCQSEIDHEINAVLSFLPILMTLAVDSFWAFFITSLLAAAFDLTFVIMQRYNRPRIVRMLQKKQG